MQIPEYLGIRLKLIRRDRKSIIIIGGKGIIHDCLTEAYPVEKVSYSLNLYFERKEGDFIERTEILKYAVENGIIDLEHVQEEIHMKEREKILEEHPYKIWFGKDGEWHTYLPDEEKGRVQRHRKTEKEIQNLIVKYWKEQRENPTLQEVFNEYNERRLQLKKISAATHVRERQDFDRFYSEWKKRGIKDIKEEEVGDFLEEQVAKHNLTAKAYSNLKGLTKRMFKRARKRKLICFRIEDVFNEMDMSEVDFKKTIKEDYQEVFTETDYPIMMDYLETHIDIWNIGIIMMFVTGIRVGELVTLSYSDFEEHENFFSIKIRHTETRFQDENKKWIYEVKNTPKTDAGIRNVVIPIQYSWIYHELKKMNPDGDYVFMRNGQRMTTNAIRRRMKRICTKLNIYPKSPHKARKTYGSILIDNRLDERLIISQMGHTNISCTENHYHRNRKTLETKAKIFSSIHEFDTPRYQKVSS